MNEDSEVEKATDDLIEFLKYAESWNKEKKIVRVWQQKEGQFVFPMKVGIQVRGQMIYPYTSMFQTEDAIRESAKREIEEKTKNSY